ncbi:lecithin retinol acyltransferase family protein [Halopseudomonas phragmitis]|nr:MULTISPECIES: lecithin retinol acyltransferase family protein [Pseudomonadaceae]
MFNAQPIAMNFTDDPHLALWDLGRELEPAAGTHLISPRNGYWHHGIYVGRGRVVHYAGLCRDIHGGPVEEVGIDRFAAGEPVLIHQRPDTTFSGREVVHRARSRLGERRYHILTNNCEHFCNWCLSGQHRSYQVRSYLIHPLAAYRLARRLAPRWLGQLGGVQSWLDGLVSRWSLNTIKLGWPHWGSLNRLRTWLGY